MNQLFACMECGRTYPLSEIRYRCDCGEPLDIEYEHIEELKISHDTFDSRLAPQKPPAPDKQSVIHNPQSAFELSGVWRFRELLPDIDATSIVSRPEGNTNLYMVGASEASGLRRVGEYAGIEWLTLKHEGENPTGSFKDRGMTVGVSQAAALGANAVACASTGNTSASLASYAAQAGIPCFVFIPEGNIALGKLAQTLAYGAITLQVRGDFDMAMEMVQQVCAEMSIYLVNSINPFRIEGQKTIALEMLQQLGWEPPDWIVLPAGNLGNTAATGKALLQARDLGLISKLPRIASVQASGANPFFRSFQSGFSERFTVSAHTVASAIKIGAPVSYARARRAIKETNGTVTQVDDAAILEAKALIDRAGIGCEPASAASVAGARKLVEAGLISKRDRVACILTGNILKDPDTTISYHMDDTDEAKQYTNRPIVLDGGLDEVRRTIERYS